MRIIYLLVFSVYLALAPTVLLAAESSPTQLRAFLVIASKQAGPTDGRLAPYEPTLRRILRFDSFRLIGEGSTDLASSGNPKISLSNGHTLELTPDGKAGRLGVKWQSGGRSLMSTGLSLRPGVPAVLGGPSSGKEGEVWAIILIAN